MLEYLDAAGPLIWAVLALGAATVSVIAALLATVLGFQLSVGGLRQVAAEDRWIYLVGLSEGLNNVVIALVLVGLASLLLTIGAYRRADSIST